MNTTGASRMKKSKACRGDRDSQRRGDTLFGHNKKRACPGLEEALFMLIAGGE